MTSFRLNIPLHPSVSADQDWFGSATGFSRCISPLIPLKPAWLFIPATMFAFIADIVKGETPDWA